MDKLKGMQTCKVCGMDFPLIEEEHYIARSDAPGGVTKTLAGGEPPIFDAIDCPYCGCQNVLQNRKRIYVFDDCPCDYGICDECQKYKRKEDKNDE